MKCQFGKCFLFVPKSCKFERWQTQFIAKYVRKLNNCRAFGNAFHSPCLACHLPQMRASNRIWHSHSDSHLNWPMPCIASHRIVAATAIVAGPPDRYRNAILEQIKPTNCCNSPTDACPTKNCGEMLALKFMEATSTQVVGVKPFSIWKYFVYGLYNIFCELWTMIIYWDITRILLIFYFIWSYSISLSYSSSLFPYLHLQSIIIIFKMLAI